MGDMIRDFLGLASHDLSVVVADLAGNNDDLLFYVVVVMFTFSTLVAAFSYYYGCQENAENVSENPQQKTNPQPDSERCISHAPSFTDIYDDATLAGRTPVQSNVQAALQSASETFAASASSHTRVEKCEIQRNSESDYANENDLQVHCRSTFALASPQYEQSTLYPLSKSVPPALEEERKDCCISTNQNTPLLQVEKLFMGERYDNPEYFDSSCFNLIEPNATDISRREQMPLDDFSSISNYEKHDKEFKKSKEGIVSDEERLRASILHDCQFIEDSNIQPSNYEKRKQASAMVMRKQSCAKEACTVDNTVNGSLRIQEHGYVDRAILEENSHSCSTRDVTCLFRDNSNVCLDESSIERHKQDGNNSFSSAQPLTEAIKLDKDGKVELDVLHRNVSSAKQQLFSAPVLSSASEGFETPSSMRYTGKVFNEFTGLRNCGPATQSSDNCSAISTVSAIPPINTSYSYANKNSQVRAYVPYEQTACDSRLQGQRISALSEANKRIRKADLVNNTAIHSKHSAHSTLDERNSTGEQIVNKVCNRQSFCFINRTDSNQREHPPSSNTTLLLDCSSQIGDFCVKNKSYASAKSCAHSASPSTYPQERARNEAGYSDIKHSETCCTGERTVNPSLRSIQSEELTTNCANHVTERSYVSPHTSSLYRRNEFELSCATNGKTIAAKVNLRDRTNCEYTVNMGQLLTTIFATDRLEEVPLDEVSKLGGKIVVSECGEYAVIDVLGHVKEYKIDRQFLRKRTEFSERIRNSKDLSDLFHELDLDNDEDVVPAKKRDSIRSLRSSLLQESVPMEGKVYDLHKFIDNFHHGPSPLAVDSNLNETPIAEVSSESISASMTIGKNDDSAPIFTQLSTESEATSHESTPCVTDQICNSSNGSCDCRENVSKPATADSSSLSTSTPDIENNSVKTSVLDLKATVNEVNSSDDKIWTEYDVQADNTSYTDQQLVEPELDSPAANSTCLVESGEQNFLRHDSDPSSARVENSLRPPSFESADKSPVVLRSSKSLNCIPSSMAMDATDFTVSADDSSLGGRSELSRSMDRLRRSKSSDLRRKKPRLILSAKTLGDETPRIRETNIDQLLDSLSSRKHAQLTTDITDTVSDNPDTNRSIADSERLARIELDVDYATSVSDFSPNVGPKSTACDSVVVEPSSTIVDLNSPPQAYVPASAVPPMEESSALHSGPSITIIDTSRAKVPHNDDSSNLNANVFENDLPINSTSEILDVHAKQKDVRLQSKLTTVPNRHLDSVTSEEEVVSSNYRANRSDSTFSPTEFLSFDQPTLDETTFDAYQTPPSSRPVSNTDTMLGTTEGQENSADTVCEEDEAHPIRVTEGINLNKSDSGSVRVSLQVSDSTQSDNFNKNFPPNSSEFNVQYAQEELVEHTTIEDRERVPDFTSLESEPVDQDNVLEDSKGFTYYDVSATSIPPDTEFSISVDQGRKSTSFEKLVFNHNDFNEKEMVGNLSDEEQTFSKKHTFQSERIEIIDEDIAQKIVVYEEKCEVDFSALDKEMDDLGIKAANSKCENMGVYERSAISLCIDPLPGITQATQRRPLLRNTDDPTDESDLATTEDIVRHVSDAFKNASHVSKTPLVEDDRTSCSANPDPGLKLNANENTFVMHTVSPQEYKAQLTQPISDLTKTAEDYARFEKLSASDDLYCLEITEKYSPNTSLGDEDDVFAMPCQESSPGLPMQNQDTYVGSPDLEKQIPFDSSKAVRPRSLSTTEIAADASPNSRIFYMAPRPASTNSHVSEGVLADIEADHTSPINKKSNSYSNVRNHHDKSENYYNRTSSDSRVMHRSEFDRLPKCIRVKRVTRRSKLSESSVRSTSLTSVSTLSPLSPSISASGMKHSRSLKDIFLDGDLETDIDEVNDDELRDVLNSPALQERAPDVKVTNLDSAIKPMTSNVPVVEGSFVPCAVMPDNAEQLPRDDTCTKESSSEQQDTFQPFVPDRTEFTRPGRTIYMDSPKSELNEGFASSHLPKFRVTYTNVLDDIHESVHDSTQTCPSNMSLDDKINTTSTENCDVHTELPSKVAKRSPLLRVQQQENKRDSWDVLEGLSSKANKRSRSTTMVETGELRKMALNTANQPARRNSWNILDLKEQQMRKHALYENADDVFYEGTINSAIVRDYKRDSSDVSYLFEKYQLEREALKSIWKQTSHEYSSDAFSDISSLSDSCSESKSDLELVTPDAIDSKRVFQQKSPNRSPKRLASPSKVAEKPSISEPIFTFEEFSEQFQSGNVTPFVNGANHMSPVAKREKIRSSPTVEPDKPSFVPSTNMFDDEDLSNMMIAKAASAVRSRRRRRQDPPSPKRNINSQQPLSPSTAITGTSPQLGSPTKTSTPSESRIEDSHVSTKPLEIPPVSEKEVQLQNQKLIAQSKRRERQKTSDSGISEGQISPRHIGIHDHDMKLAVQPASLKRSQELWSLEKDDSTGREYADSYKSSELETRESIQKLSRPNTSSPIVGNSPASINEKRHLSSLSLPKKRTASMSDDLNSKHRSYERIRSLPNIRFSEADLKPMPGGRSLEQSPIGYESDEYQSETSILSESCFERFEGSVDEDEMLIYPSLHLRSSQNLRSNFDDAESDSSDENSFNEVSFREPRVKSSTERTVYCGYPPCKKQQRMSGNERSAFTSCPSCFTCYCSRACRRSHWPEHKRICFFGRISYYIRSLIRRCEKEPDLNIYLSRIAREGFHSSSKGCLMFAFPSPTEAKIFLMSKDAVSNGHPMYLTTRDLHNQHVRSRHLTLLAQTLLDYDPDQEFVLNISINVSGNRDQGSKRKIRSSTVLRCARIPFIETPSTRSLSSYEIRTFSLPSTPGVDAMTDTEARRYYCREISHSLKRCGVRLKYDYPSAYHTLCSYVEDSLEFSPIILYGQKDERNYKCILYPAHAVPDVDMRGAGILV